MRAFYSFYFLCKKSYVIITLIRLVSVFLFTFLYSFTFLKNSIKDYYDVTSNGPNLYIWLPFGKKHSN